MLLNLHKKSWIDGLSVQHYGEHCKTNEKTVQSMLELAQNYHKVCSLKIFFHYLCWGVMGTIIVGILNTFCCQNF